MSVCWTQSWSWVCESLTTLGQHALLRLLQLLAALCRIRLQHPLTCAHAASTRHAALAPVRPGRQHARDGVYTHTHTGVSSDTHTGEEQLIKGLQWTHGTRASCTSPPRPPQFYTWSRRSEASSPCARVSSSPAHRWRCRGPTPPTQSPHSCWELWNTHTQVHTTNGSSLTMSVKLIDWSLERDQ